MTTTPETATLAKRPVSVWNRNLKLDAKAFFIALGKAATHGVTFDWPKASRDLIDAAAATGLKRDWRELAWLLLYRSIMRSISELSNEAVTLIPHDAPKTMDVEAMANLAARAFEDTEVEIERQMFAHPGSEPIVHRVREGLRTWLRGVGLTERQAESIESRFPSYFVFALCDEWRERPAEYAPIRDALDTPLTRSAEVESGWLRYAAWLQRKLSEPMFGEAFSVEDVYVPIRAYFERRVDGRPGDFGTPSVVRSRVVVSLDDVLDSWSRRRDPDDAIRLVSGGPGSGKSTFARRFAARQAEEGACRVLFVPLHLLDPTGDLCNSVGQFVTFDRFLVRNPLHPTDGESQLLLVLDGLDELVMQGRLGAEVAIGFVREVSRTVARMNQSGARLLVLITGRELVVQATMDDFRKEGQVLHVLPYFVPTGERNGYTDPDGFLAVDQRDLWWSRYGTAAGLPYSCMPAELNRPKLTDVTSQPLLNYLVALSYVRGRVTFSGQPNLNDIYADLLARVYERGWAKGQHPALRNVSQDQFERVLEEVALSAWHGDGRSTTVREIELHCERSNLKKFLDLFVEGAQSGVTRLLTAFYFRRSGQRLQGDATFEFTHRSFGEYLIARRLTRAARHISAQRLRNEIDPEEGWSERTCVQYLLDMCGPTAIDRYLLDFLRDEIRTAPHADVPQWQATFSSLLKYAIRVGPPFEHQPSRPSFHEELRQSRNVNEAILAIVNGCALRAHKVSDLTALRATEFRNWWQRMHLGRKGPDNPVAYDCLSWLALTDCDLDAVDLYRADLSNSELRDCRMSYAFLLLANLRDAKLEGTNFTGANLCGADLSGATLGESALSSAVVDRRTNVSGTLWEERISPPFEKADEWILPDLRERANELEHTRGASRTRSGRVREVVE